jgi:3-methyladenine DNA glycosylase AlkD
MVMPRVPGLLYAPINYYLGGIKPLTMTCAAVMQQLEAMGSESTKRTLLNHGAKEPFFGVKVGDLKTLQKKIKKDHVLSLALYNTGNSDAQYLAGLIADENKITKDDLQHWVKTAAWHMQSEYTVPWIAAESRYGYILALEWIDAKEPSIQASGWTTLASLAGIKKDEELDIPQLRNLMHRVQAQIHTAPNRVRYCMNTFILAVGCHVKDLTDEAITIAHTVGPITVDMNGTACKVSFAPEYIEKVKASGKLGNKKKMARC